MIALRFVFVAVIGLIRADSSESAGVKAGCSAETPANLDQCKKAITNIKLDNGKLPGNEPEIRAISDSCSIVVLNRQLVKDVTPDQITEALNTHFKNCPSQGGSIALLGHKDRVFLQIKTRNPVGSKDEALNADAELNKPYCSQPKTRPSTTSFSDDCLAAYKNFRANPNTGILTIPGPKGSQVISASCMIQITTTDGTEAKM
ncbi:hypothetical protein PTTG_25534 [Puccinia triticina 1-1 BBBD Race 1]|uniref:Secreted protein n=2 Tax=Puccinia triticina TaxID=208348 RepID=A0A180H2L6_PUCT1|nr:uncharacterized protein PtA15_5A672 [Puccinia triticina]OAV98849.1 hypothetical protein PTTG_25534 [Puccinia triticina 1-1 BBBD Race 1]WAQ85098.1 hypothetical protein PtA15_5A672 [Puccinia triticina]